MVSIIVPVYNVEIYLRRCLDSILSQTCSDLELILVDDGSPDGCPAICDEYAMQDSRVRVIHKENGGVSRARNAGLEIATGTYLTFCDSDDYYAPEWLENLVSAMEMHHADVVVGGYTKVFADGTDRAVKRRETGIYDTPTPDAKVKYAFEKIFGNKHGWEVWTRLFRMNIVKQNKIGFCETCQNFAEDLGFTLEYSLHANRVVSVEDAGYFYFFRSGSMMYSSAGQTKFDCANEVSLYFAEKCRNAFDRDFADSVLPIYHFLIMHDRYLVIIDTENYSRMREYAADIQRYSEWKSCTKQIFACRKKLVTYFGKYNAGRILLLSRYCIHGSWLRFKIECALYYKLNKPQTQQ